MFPEKLNGYTLHEGFEPHYAFYFKEIGLGFAHALRIARLVTEEDADDDHSIVQVQYLSGNSWGRTEDGRPRTCAEPYTLTWLQCRCDYYPTMQRTIAALRGDAEVPRGKRKPRPIAPMTESEIKAFVDRVAAEIRG